MVGLLGQLPPRGVQRRLAGHVEQAGGQLPQLHPHRVPVLPHQEHPLVLVEGQHRDRPGVADVLPPDDARVAEVDLLPDDVPDQAVEDPLAAEDPA